MSTPEKMDRKTFDLLAGATVLFVLAFLTGEIWAVSIGEITWKQFLEDVGTPAFVMLAYWRGSSK